MGIIRKFEKFIARVKWHMKELNKTLSSQESYYSSKRIERLIIFINANVLLDMMVMHLLHKDKIDYLGAIAIYGAQMVYAGFQTKQIFKDKVPDDGSGTDKK